MTLDISRAIAEIRKRLDEIEALAVQLPDKKKSQWIRGEGYGYSPTPRLLDLFEKLEIPKKPSIRRKLSTAVWLMEHEGVFRNDLTINRRLRQAVAFRPYLDRVLDAIDSQEKP